MLLNNANASLFSLHVPGLEGLSFTLLSIHYDESISKMDQVEIQLGIPGDFSPADLLEQPFHLSWDSQDSAHDFHGLVTGIRIAAFTEHQNKMTLTGVSPLHALTVTQQSRHFTYKNLQSIITEVVKGTPANFLSLHFNFSAPDLDRPHTAQHHESDLSFIERILHEVGACYFLVHRSEGVTFHVTDQASSFPLLSAAVPFETLSQGTKSSEAVFEIKKALGQDEIMLASSDSRAMRSGHFFQLSGHPEPFFNQAYLIVSVEHRVDETSTGLRYTNKLRLLPGNLSFKPDYDEPSARINTLSLAQIHSDNDAPLLTEKGEYILRSPHNDELTHPVRLATPYAGPDYGMHFPLHKNTQVIVAYLNGHPDKPVMLGSLYNDEQTNVVTSENARQNRWVTQSGHTFLLDDQPQHQKIALHTAEQLHRLILDATQDQEKIELVSETGEFQAAISQSTEFTTEDNYELSAGESITMRAQQDCHFASDEANMVCEAAKDMTQQAGQDLNLHAENDMHLRADGNSETLIKGSMRTDISGGDYLLKLMAGNLRHEAQRNLQYSTASGDIVLKTAQASVNFKANGDIQFSAKNIILQAGNIDIHNAGEGRGN